MDLVCESTFRKDDIFHNLLDNFAKLWKLFSSWKKSNWNRKDDNPFKIKRICYKVSVISNFYSNNHVSDWHNKDVKLDTTTWLYWWDWS